MTALSEEPDPSSRLLRRADLVAGGITDADLRRTVRNGTVRRVHQGIYLLTPLVDPAELDWQRVEREYLLRIRAVASRNPRSVVSHLSAAALHGLPVFQADRSTVHLTRLGSTGAELRPTIRVHAGPLTCDQITEIDGVAVTTVERTLLDVPCLESEITAVAAIDAALNRGVAAIGALGAQLHQARGRTHAARARRAFAAADGRSESPGESWTRLVLRAPDLPVLDLQVTVCDEDGNFVGRADAGVEEAGVLIEYDGRSKYGRSVSTGEPSGQVVHQEKLREDGFRRLHHFVERITNSDLARPGTLRSRVRRTIATAMVERKYRRVAGTYQPKPPLVLP